MMPPFSVNVFATSAWVMPQRRFSSIEERLLTDAASPFSCLPAFPGGGARLSFPWLELPEDEPPEPPDDEPPEAAAGSAEGSAGSTIEACLGSVGWQARAAPRAKANEPS